MKKNSHNEDAFKKLIKESGLESPSKDFTASLMKMVAPEGKPSFINQPTFNRKQVFSFALMFGVLMVYALISGSTFSLSKWINLHPVAETFSGIMKAISSPILLVLIISGWTLYIFDRLIKKFSLFRT